MRLQRNFRIVINVPAPDWVGSDPERETRVWRTTTQQLSDRVRKVVVGVLGARVEMVCDDYHVCDWCVADYHVCDWCGAEVDPKSEVVRCEFGGGDASDTKEV